jgi:integrase
MKMSFPIRKHYMKGQLYWIVDLRKIGKGRKVYKTKAEAEAASGTISAEFLDNGAVFLADNKRDNLTQNKLADRLAEFGVSLDTVVTQWIEAFGNTSDISTADALQECIIDKERTGKRERTTQQYQYTFDELKKHLPSKLALCRTAHVEAWLHKAKWKPRTQKSQLSHAQAFFSWCVRKGYLKKNPCEGTEPILVEHDVPGILTVEQAQKLMDVCHKNVPKFLTYLALTLFAGIRPQEVFRMTWADVDLQQGHVSLTGPQTKTRARRIVTLTPNAIAWLKLGGDLPPKNWQRNLNRVRDIAGITEWPHDAARHSYCSYSLPIHGAMQTALNAGHSEDILFKHYREVVTKQEAEKFWQIFPKHQT